MATPIQDQLVELLRGSTLLDNLPESELRELAVHIVRNRYDPGEIIFRKHDEGIGMMVVVSGRVQITSVGVGGNEVILNIIDPGQVFGEMALLDGGPRSADAVAASRTETITLRRNDFVPILKRHPDAALRMMTVLCRRIRQTTAFVEDAIFLDVPTRLLNRLRGLADQYGKRDAGTGAVLIDHKLSQQNLGDSVGLTRVSINRQLGIWRQAGLIETGRGWINVPDFEELEDAVLDGRNR